MRLEGGWIYGGYDIYLRMHICLMDYFSDWIDSLMNMTSMS
jgi:hypothetical protein